MKKILTVSAIILGLLGASRIPARAAGQGCQDTTGALTLEKIRADATGTFFLGCINRTFDKISTGTIVNSTFSTGNIGTLYVSTIGAVSTVDHISIASSTIFKSTTATDNHPIVSGRNNVGSELWRFTQGGKLGIGTSLPLYPLHNVGTAYIAGQLITTGTGTIVGSQFSVGTSTLAVKNGRLGINNADPTYTLDLTFPVTTSSLVRKLQLTDATFSTMALESSQTENAWVSNVDASMRVSGGQADLFIKSPGGEVGISTNNPQFNLDVYGDAGTADTAVRVANGAAGGGEHRMTTFSGSIGNAVAGDSMLSNTVGHMLISPNVAGKDIKLVGGVWTDAVSMTIKDGGNVGISSSTPTDKLGVGGDINVSGVYKQGTTAGTTVSCSAGQAVGGAVIKGGITTAGSCISTGGGDAVLAATQTFTGGNTFTNQLVVSTSIRVGAGQTAGTGAIKAKFDMAGSQDYVISECESDALCFDFDGQASPDLVIHNSGAATPFLQYQGDSCRANQASGTSLTNATWTTPSLNERWDTSNYHDNGVNPSRMTIPRTGFYNLFCNGEFDLGNANGTAALRFIVNGATVIAVEQHETSGGQSGTGSGDPIISLGTHWRFVAGDYVECQAWQQTGTARTLNGTSAYSFEVSITYAGSN